MQRHHVIVRPAAAAIAAALAVSILFAPAQPRAQEPGPESPRWIPEGGMKLREDGSVLLLTGSRGWLRTARYYTDFTLTLEFRLGGADARAALSIRDPGSALLRIPITNATDGPQALASFSALGRRADGASFDRDALAEATRGVGEWQRLRVEATRDAARVLLNEVPISAIGPLPQPTGFITLRSEHGRVEIRNVHVLRRQTAREPFGDGAVAPKETGLTLPRAIRRRNPDYPFHVLAGEIKGLVVLDLVIEPDGTVGDVRVEESPHPDLAESAIGAVRQWTFQPGTKDGVPVRVVVRLKIEFKLK